MTRTRVPRFCLQSTRSFPEGAPQREEWETDETFQRACELYELEWRYTYVCGDTMCRNRDCPEHFPTVI